MAKPTPFQCICLFAGWAVLWQIVFYFIEQFNAENRVEPILTTISSELSPTTTRQ